MSERVTIKSIANDLGISHMTVSRALSGNPNVQVETRQAIIKRAEELGYVKSAAANAMRGEQTNIVGLLLPNLVNEFYARYSDTLAQSCDEQGLQLIIHLTNDDIEKERRAIMQLREVQANSVVMVPSPGDMEGEEKPLRGLHIVQLIRQRNISTPCKRVLVDDHSAIEAAVGHLASQGLHKHIAYIGGDTSLSSGKSRLAAFLSGMKKAGLEPMEEFVCVDAPSFAFGHNVADSIVRSGRASAIICGGVEVSNGALNACLEHGVKLADDIAFVGYGDPSYYQWICGGISTIKIPAQELAVITAQLLVNRDQPDQCLSLKKVLSADLVIRNSSVT